MNFQKYDLGKLDSSKTVEVTLSGSVTNVRLLDEENLYNYVRNRNYTFFGGLVKKSPIRFKVPHLEHWYIVIDMKGLEGTADGTTKASVTIK